jgi:catechol 2,3-dioxygenase-like lactoylglutathione lyase family enzyme
MSAVFDHCGFVVRDLDGAIRFFVETLGAIELRRGEVADPSGETMTAVFGVEPRAASRFVFFAFGETEIELLEWSGPGRDERIPGNSDLGGRHLALRLPHLEETLQHLVATPGFEVRAISSRGFHYVRTPFGIELQLFPKS